ncbi:MAG: beta-propeller domain-containing protein [Oscillospiraceae bacterium]|jgi:uncharacterized secreted protein with C-terminal beta-propeller domain|nr:beta-propeller domain-containing protein [Oscillospiraceae bacterium]
MFEERYKAINDSIHSDSKNLDAIKKLYESGEIMKNTSKTHSAGKSTMFKRYAAAAAGFVLICGAVMSGIYFSGRGITAPISNETVTAAGSYDEVYKTINQFMVERDRENTREMIASVFNGAADMVTGKAVPDMATAEAASDSGAGGTSDFSQTNTQVSGVDEADVVKTDGRYIYTLRDKENGAGSYISIVEANNGQMSKIVDLMIENSNIDKIKEGANIPIEFYVSGDRLAVLCSVRNYSDVVDLSRNFPTVSVLVYDISDRSNPKLMNTLGQTGSYESSRLIGDYIYLITEQYIYDKPKDDKLYTYVPTLYAGSEDSCVEPADIFIGFNPENAYTIVASINIKDAKEHSSVKALLSNTSNVYCSTDTLLISSEMYSREETEGVVDGKNAVVIESKSETKLVSFSLKDGAIEQTASGTVPGRAINQFAFDRYGDTFRIVTNDNSSRETIFTDGIDVYEYEGDTGANNGIYVLDKSLKIIGTLNNLAKGEHVQSVRFDGNTAYFVTFRQVDPLFTVDLTDPNNPKLMSELKIPGFSQYLHKYDDGLLFGLGYDADVDTGRTTGMKISMFDTSNPYDVTEKHTLKIDADWSEASYNHKAILVSKEKNLIAFPADGGYKVYSYDRESGFELVKQVAFDSEMRGNMRGMFIGDYFYINGYSKLASYKLPNFEETARLNF